MNNQYIAASTIFLIQTLFGLYILVVMLRLLLQWVRADFYNPVSQFIVKVTNPPLKPLRRVIPGWGGIDLASVLLLIALQMLELFLVNLAMGRAFGIAGLSIEAIAELLSLLINVFIGAILIQVILSWVAPSSYNPVIGLVHRIADPVLAPARRLLPPMSGIDFSPLVVLIVLQLLKILVVAPIANLGYHLG
ncbi:MAG: YggT family protein [Gammaproteobacteria bacterium]|jgi:YggT family protein